MCKICTEITSGSWISEKFLELDIYLLNTWGVTLRKRIIAEHCWMKNFQFVYSLQFQLNPQEFQCFDSCEFRENLKSTIKVVHIEKCSERRRVRFQVLLLFKRYKETRNEKLEWRGEQKLFKWRWKFFHSKRNFRWEKRGENKSFPRKEKSQGGVNLNYVAGEMKGWCWINRCEFNSFKDPWSWW